MRLERLSDRGVGPSAEVITPLENKLMFGSAQFMFLSLGEGEKRSSSFTVSASMNDVRTIIDTLAERGNAEAITMQRDLTLAASVRKAIASENAE